MDVSLNQTDDTCRCCLKSGHLVSLFDEIIFEELEIFKAVTQIVPININKNDGYSQNICIDCKKKVEEFYNFRQMCISSDESMKSNRRPVSRNNEHDYSTLIDEYDMDLSEYLIEPSTLKDETSAEESVLETEIVENKVATAIPVLDETQLNFNGSSSKKVNRKTYACPICYKLWITPSKLKRHLGSHKYNERTSSKHHQCSICNASFESQFKLSQHLNIHVKAENRQVKMLVVTDCDICGLECATPQKLQNHMKIQHLRHISIISTGNTLNQVPEKMMTNSEMKKCEDLYTTCDECGKSFATAIKLRRHVKIHIKTDKKPPPRQRPRRHECIHCGKMFESPSKLTRHMAVHRDMAKSTTPSETALEISTVTSILGD